MGGIPQADERMPGWDSGGVAQSEWRAMDLAKPGYYTLIQDGIENEGEAERLARGTSGGSRPRNSKRIMRSWPGETTAPLAGAGPDCPVAG